jgi:hypothetical protein
LHKIENILNYFAKKLFNMRKLILVQIVCISCFTWANSQTFNIIDFGAKPNNKTINTKSIQSAVDSCTRHGGGTVYVPSGIFVSGTIELKSNVNLYLETGAEIKGSPNLSDYKDYQRPGFEPVHYGVVFAYKAENVSITGQGAIDGNEESFFEWDKPKKIDLEGSQFTRQKEKFRLVTSGIGDGPVVPKDRPRQMVIFSECKNVLLQNIKLTKASFWTLHFADCDGVVVTGLKVWNSQNVPNNDGMDFTSCSNVVVSNCDIRTGDDAIVITGFAYHFELPGYSNLRHLSENFNITNCNLQSRSSGIRIGYMDQNTVRNINISNINITNSNRGIGIFVRDEGSLENIKISQVYIDTRLHTGDWWGNGEPIHISAVRGKKDGKLGQVKHVIFRDITCRGEAGILLYGSEESAIEDVRFENIKFDFVKSKIDDVAGGNIDLQYINGLVLNNVELSWGAVDKDYYKYGIHVDNFSGLKLTDVKASASPSDPALPAVLVENGSGFKTDLDAAFYKEKNIKK